eukprot:gene27436-4737_t
MEAKEFTRMDTKMVLPCRDGGLQVGTVCRNELAHLLYIGMSMLRNKRNELAHLIYNGMWMLRNKRNELAHLIYNGMSMLRNKVTTTYKKPMKNLLQEAMAKDWFDSKLVDLLMDTFNIDLLEAIMKEYTRRLRRSNCLDFDDLLGLGDPDQAIYSWRGAVPENMSEVFEEDFPMCNTVFLTGNYRSGSNILKASEGVLSMGGMPALHRELRAERQILGHVEHRLVANEREEAEWTARKIRLLASDGIPLSEMAILYRRNVQSRLFQEMLSARNIPYRVIGDIAFYSRAEIKDTVCFLRLAASPASDTIALSRIINTPPRGIINTPPRGVGAKAEETMQAAAAELDTSLAGLLFGNIPDVVLSRDEVETLLNEADRHHTQLNRHNHLESSIRARQLVNQTIETQTPLSPFCPGLLFGDIHDVVLSREEVETLLKEADRHHTQLNRHNHLESSTRAPRLVNQMTYKISPALFPLPRPPVWRQSRRCPQPQRGLLFGDIPDVFLSREEVETLLKEVDRHHMQLNSDRIRAKEEGRTAASDSKKKPKYEIGLPDCALCLAPEFPAELSAIKLSSTCKAAIVLLRNMIVLMRNTARKKPKYEIGLPDCALCLAPEFPAELSAIKISSNCKAAIVLLRNMIILMRNIARYMSLDKVVTLLLLASGYQQHIKDGGLGTGNPTKKLGYLRVFCNIAGSPDQWMRKGRRRASSQPGSLSSAGSVDSGGFTSDEIEWTEDMSEADEAEEDFDDEELVGLTSLLEHVALSREMDERKDDAVRHVEVLEVDLEVEVVGRGLEYRCVFFTAFEEGLVPNVRMNEATNYAEEKRLAYVGTTRAKDKLYIITAKMRNLYGSPKGRKQCAPSRFLGPLADQLGLDLVRSGYLSKVAAFPEDSALW